MSENYYSAGSFEQAPVGMHDAMLIKVIDIGTQEGEYEGKKTSRRQEIWTWELPEELMGDGQPYIISKFYTASLGDQAKLTEDLTSWLGKKPDSRNFVPKSLLGKGCTITVAERPNGKHVVANVNPLGKKAELPEKPHNAILFFSLRPELFNQEIFDGLSEGIKKMIMKSPEYGAVINGEGFDQTVQANEKDEVPF